MTAPATIAQRYVWSCMVEASELLGGYETTARNLYAKGLAKESEPIVYIRKKARRASFEITRLNALLDVVLVMSLDEVKKRVQNIRAGDGYEDWLEQEDRIGVKSGLLLSDPPPADHGANWGYKITEGKPWR